MKLHEARRALGEMRVSLSAEHVREVEEQLRKAEAEPQGPSNPSGHTP